ncbi:MAG: lytic transglycosylase domain-containing protein [Lentilitoribacter sp.]
MKFKNRYVSILFVTAFSLVQFTPLRVHSDVLPFKYSTLCDRAAVVAANAIGIPIKILKAVGRTESGISVDGQFVPWPWTVNVEGQGVRLSSRQEASLHIKDMRDRGKKNIDIGCFQINHRWHSSNFSSVDDMLNPISNARYSAEFLKELYVEYGDWMKAVGAYHSKNREFSERYLTKFKPILKNMEQSTGENRNYAEGSRAPNAFPLLKGSSESGNKGSLFPTNTRSNGSLLRLTETRG